MPFAQKLDTHHKALTLNLDPSTFGSFAEIGAGQEVVRWFLSCPTTNLKTAATSSDSFIALLGVTFLGVVDGKHRCRPATEEELRQPETDEFFQEIWCTEPETASLPGRVWVRNRKNGFYGMVAVEDLALATKETDALYTPWA